jgi:putative sterol carrier protein
MSPSERAEYGLAMLQAGFIGPPNGEPPRDPASLELLMTSVARAIDTRTAPAGPFTVQWEFADAEPWHVVVDNGSTAAAAGRAPRVDLELRCRYQDFVDVVAGRLDPRRALATRKLRPHGSPRAIWAARTLFA